MGEVVPARTSPTLHPPSPPTVHQLLRLALSELISLNYTSGQQKPVHSTWYDYLKSDCYAIAINKSIEIRAQLIFRK